MNRKIRKYFSLQRKTNKEKQEKKNLKNNPYQQKWQN